MNQLEKPLQPFHGRKGGGNGSIPTTVIRILAQKKRRERKGGKSLCARNPEELRGSDHSKSPQKLLGSTIVPVKGGFKEKEVNEKGPKFGNLEKA